MWLLNDGKLIRALGSGLMTADFHEFGVVLDSIEDVHS